MKLLTFLSVALIGTSAFAKMDICAIEAQSYAVQAYTSENSRELDQIGYSSELVKIQKDERTFEVAINDSNNADEIWTVIYEVTVKQISKDECALISLENLGTDDGTIIDEL